MSTIKPSTSELAGSSTRLSSIDFKAWGLEERPLSDELMRRVSWGTFDIEGVRYYHPELGRNYNREKVRVFLIKDQERAVVFSLDSKFICVAEGDLERGSGL